MVIKNEDEIDKRVRKIIIEIGQNAIRGDTANQKVLCAELAAYLYVLCEIDAD